MHQLELSHQQIAELSQEAKQLTIERNELHIQSYKVQTDGYEMLSRQRQSIPVSGHGNNVQSRVVTSPLHMPELITEQSSESSGDEERQLPTPSRSRGSRNTRPHPPGFKEIYTPV